MSAKQNAWLERPYFQGSQPLIRATCQTLARPTFEQLRQSRLYKDIVEYAGGERSMTDSWNQVLNLVSEHISAAGNRLLLETPLSKGQALALELELQGFPRTVQVLAVAVLDSTELNSGLHGTCLHFLGIKRDDIKIAERHLVAA